MIQRIHADNPTSRERENQLGYVPSVHTGTGLRSRRCPHSDENQGTGSQNSRRRDIHKAVFLGIKGPPFVASFAQGTRPQLPHSDLVVGDSTLATPSPIELSTTQICKLVFVATAFSMPVCYSTPPHCQLVHRQEHYPCRATSANVRARRGTK